MKNKAKYRVLQKGGMYYPQKKVLFFWVCMRDTAGNIAWSYSLDQATKYTKNYIEKIKEIKQEKVRAIHYLDDLGQTRKEKDNQVLRNYIKKYDKYLTRKPNEIRN